MFAHISILAVARLSTTVLITSFFAYIYSVKRLSYLLAWAAGWGLLALRSLSLVFATPGASGWFGVIGQWLLATAALMLFAAAQLYATSRPWTRSIILAAGAFAAWVIAFHLGRVHVSPGVGVGLVFLAIARIFWKQSRQQDTYADVFMAVAFLIWAPIPFLGWYFTPIGGTAPQTFPMFANLQELFAAAIMVMAIYEEEKRRVERNLVALANLSLSTASFVGSEIDRTLSQALDRVLSVVRLSAGAILLHHADAHGPTAVVSVGLDSSFCRTIEDEHLDTNLMRLVTRLGGLVVFRDIGRDSAWAALENEESFPRFRKLVIAHGLRTIVGISLQAKAQPFGVLLLGTADNRRFGPSELRLLLALGHQIGMAVENSYLIQQTARRTEKLHILNETGQALSSTLDPDALFERIFTEMRRMFDVNSFFIALCDTGRDLIRFELDVSDGIRLPKRTRPAGNHLIEYIIRTRQPVLLRDDIQAEGNNLGVQPLQQGKSFCGVPLLVYERAIGVLAVQNAQGHVYDEEHLETMRVLASQASIAIENARLFREEQTKSRHLTLLNNISRNAITTLNPDEMLANIAQELEEGLTFDHVDISLLDYATKEVVVQAEGGSRRGALGRRLALGHSLIGVVARTGQMCAVRDVSSSVDPAPIMEGSASAIALPIIYADQLHGVLNIETAALTDFSEEEVLLLHTLADLISGALHNALTFQKAQEQAITDGLTGVKTHRFLMEALSAEWKRSTRGGRAFSLVVMDLDRFKFVNDFYGHLEGDLVLTRVGHILEQNCRRSDVVARYGGDEFVILMPETSIDQGRQFAQKLRAGVCADPLLREKNITASFGIACFPVHGSTPQELIQIADASMYLSKHQGGNAVSSAEHFDPNESKKWKRDVLEAYLGVTLKRLFSTGPEAFEEIRGRLEQFALSLATTDSEGAANGNAHAHGKKAAEKTNGSAAEQTLPPAVIETVTSLSSAIDAKDHYTQGHSQKVAAYATLLAEKLRMNESEIDEIYLGGILHDIGKVGIPENILNKVGPLDPEEWETMKQHVCFGEQLLEPLRAIADVRKMVRHHHEMYDGSGYPDGLRGEQIPLGARIIAITDAYDTITSERTYKKARPSNSAFAEIKRCAGAQFDPDLVRIFIDALQDLPQPIVSEAAGASRSVPR